MTSTDELLGRINAEIGAYQHAIEELRSRGVEEYQGRQERLKLFDPLCERLSAIWGPRLEVLSKRFGEHVSVSPLLTPGRREAKFQFDSKLARVTLRFSASTDQDVRNLVLGYDLHIVPVLMSFEPHAEIAFPLEKVEDEAVGRWIDDRIIGFVRTYLALHQNEYYLKEHMVEDPVSGTRFPKHAAAATLESGGKTCYFISEETRREFEKRKTTSGG